MGDTLAGLLAVGVLVLLLAATHAPLGAHLATVFTSQGHRRVERITYRLCGVDLDKEQPWTVYAASVGAFSLLSLVLLLTVTPSTRAGWPAADRATTRGVADALTASASGLDPDISPAYATWQAPRVAAARGTTTGQVQALVDAHTKSRLLGFLGQPRVNVTELNLALTDAAG